MRESVHESVTTDRIIGYIEEDCHYGACLKCGAEAHQVEPDARKYRCEECGFNYVYGAEEILMMGWSY